VLYFSGLRARDFPVDLAAQSEQAKLIVQDLMRRILNREEDFTVFVKRVAVRRMARNNLEVLLPPFEVRISLNFVYALLALKYSFLG